MPVMQQISSKPILNMKVVLGVILVVLIAALVGTILPIMVSSSREAVDDAVELVVGRTMAQVGDSIRSYFSVAYIPVTELFRRFGRDDVSDYGPRLEGALWDLVKSVDNIRWLYLTTWPAGEWIAYERVLRAGEAPSYNFMRHVRGTEDYHYWGADAETGVPDYADNKTKKDNGTNCCGFKALQPDAGVPPARGASNWGNTFLWEDQYLVGFNRAVYDAAGKYLGVVSCEFGLVYLGEFLASLKTFASEEFFVVDGSTGDDRFIASSSSRYPSKSDAPDADGYWSPIPFANLTNNETRNPTAIPRMVQGVVESRWGNWTNLMGAIAREAKERGTGIGKVQYQLTATSGGDEYYVGLSAVEERFSEGDRNSLRFVLATVVRTDEYLRKINKGTELTVVISCCIAAGMLLVSMALVLILMRPLGELSRSMEAAQEMDFSNIGTVRTMIAEIHGLQVSFIFLVEKLEEYKSYLPKTMFADDADSDFGEELEEVGAGEADRAASAVSGWKKGGTAPSSASRTQSSRHSQRSVAGVVHSKTKIQARHRNAIVMATNLHGFTAAFLDEVDALVEFEALYVSTVQQCVERNNGTVDRMNGDRLLCSWNSARQTLSAKGRALAAGMQIKRVAVEFKSCRGMGIGISAGKVACGNLGTATNRAFMLIGAPVVTVHTLLAEATNTKSGSASVLVDGEVEKDMRLSYEMLILGQLGPKRGERGETKGKVFFEVLHEQQVEEKEWLYQVQDVGKSAFMRFNAAMRTWLRSVDEGAADVIPLVEEVQRLVTVDDELSHLFERVANLTRALHANNRAAVTV